MVFGLIEVGSTNTKFYLYEDGRVENIARIHIPFKEHYESHGEVLTSDLDALVEGMNKLKEKTTHLYAFGTSIFRKLKEDELNKVEDYFKNTLNCSFKMVTAEEESAYTVKGVTSSIDYKGRMAVVIGGGGSTELAILENNKVVRTKNFDFGAMDITSEFKSLKEDIPSVTFDEVFDYTNQLLGDFEDKADVLVLAGGDYIYFYENAGYEMDANTLYEDVNQPFLLTLDKATYYDHQIMEDSLLKIKEKTKGNEGWWDGARGMRFCMNTIAKRLGVSYIVPTRINMLLGLASEISENE